MSLNKVLEKISITNYLMWLKTSEIGCVYYFFSFLFKFCISIFDLINVCSVEVICMFIMFSNYVFRITTYIFIAFHCILQTPFMQTVHSVFKERKSAFLLIIYSSFALLMLLILY